MLSRLLPIFLVFSLAFAPHRDPSFEVGGGTIDVNLDSDLPQSTQGELMTWIHDAGNSIVAYYGRFPLPRTALEVRSFEGRGVHNGHTFGVHNGGLIRISVGLGSTPAELKRDWMLTHEMVHLTFPSVPQEHHWIEEGTAVYVEPIARFRAGNFPKERVWGEMVRDMHQGLPQQGDEGLDNTHTWGRTYWGGALFCLLADIEIHLRTQNQKGLDDALRAIMNDGGVITEDWDLERTLKSGDKAVGVPVLEQLWAKMKDKAVNVDLDKLWQQLGITQADGVATFDNEAPLAAIRESISTGKPGKKTKSRFSTDTFLIVR